MKLDWKKIRFNIQDKGPYGLMGYFGGSLLSGVLLMNWPLTAVSSVGFLAVAGYLWAQKAAKYWHHICGQIQNSLNMHIGIVQAQREQLEQYHIEEATKAIRPPGKKHRHPRPS